MRVHQLSDTVENLHALAVETVAIARRLDNPTARLCASYNLGLVESLRDPAAAIGPFCDGLEAADRGAARHMECIAAAHLSRCYAEAGDVLGAAGAIRRGLVIARDSGSRWRLAQTLEKGGQALVILGHDQEGATILVASRGLVASRNPGGVTLNERVAAEHAALARLGADRYDDAVREGAAMTPQAAIAHTISVLDELTCNPRSRQLSRAERAAGGCRCRPARRRGPPPRT
jgi:hypothetical protein